MTKSERDNKMLQLPTQLSTTLVDSAYVLPSLDPTYEILRGMLLYVIVNSLY